jgi:hypothetical protein
LGLARQRVKLHNPKDNLKEGTKITEMFLFGKFFPGYFVNDKVQLTDIYFIYYC